MFIVHPYNKYSNSARVLAKALGGRRSWKREPRAGDIVINWGDGDCPYHCLNDPVAIRLASNKKLAFDVMKQAGVSVPAFAGRIEDVSWKGMTVVRHKLQGHSGEGIELVEPGKELPNAPLYVEYIKKQSEFRIHVGRKQDEFRVLAVQRKARNTSTPDQLVNWQVRNHANGFVFVRGDASPHQSVTEQAIAALRSLGLDFGGVDVIWNQEKGQAYVLEINTAPGLEGQTIKDYADFFNWQRD